MNIIKFFCDFNCEPLLGGIVYRMFEYSIDFDPCSLGSVREKQGSMGMASLSFDTLQIEIAVDTGLLLYPWGYFPHVSWKEVSLSIPQMRKGCIRISKKMTQGVALGIEQADSWKVLKDTNTGWICFGSDDKCDNLITVEFAEGAALSIHEERAVAIWLKPTLYA